MEENDEIYKFITNQIEEYQKWAQIYTTDKFNSKKARTNNKIKMGVKIDNGLLNINFEDIKFDKEELKEIL